MESFKIGLVVTVLKPITSLTSDFKEKFEDKIDSLVIKRISKFGEVVYPGLILDISDAVRAKHEFLKNNVDIILDVELFYSTSNITYAAIKNVNKPLIILNTSLRHSIKDDYKWLDLALEQNVVGYMEFTSLLKRIGRKHVTIASGLMDDDHTYEKVVKQLKAAKIVKELANSNIGFIGNKSYPGMLDIVVDQSAVKDKFGIDIVNLNTEEIVEIFKGIKKDEMEKERERILGEYKNIPVKINDDRLNRSIKMVLCHKKLIQKYNLTSIANYCQATLYNPKIGVPPCIGSTICTTGGVPFSCEGDVGAAIALLIMKKLTGNTSFAEFWISDYKKNALLLGHCGQGNLNFAKDKNDVKIKTHTVYGKEEFSGYSFEFAYKDGESTLLNISVDDNNKWKMFICYGEIEHHKAIGIDSPHAWWKVNMNIDDFLEKWGYAGPSHHVALSYGNLKESLNRIGLLLDLEIHELC